MDFDLLNKQTRDYNNGITRTIDPTRQCAKYGTKEYWLNYYSNKKYKVNNGTYSKHYF